ncbi:hypothetical protein DUNSADRAFT_5456 [Dunaliella salina]|uniref:Uncharacterized protein n=1 Tax=Dunaliella salina TaxID=3046 RepID=A0ABQ7GQ88_DUNSA|nr:hypothetical protein DUNSADRAFT_5456 [Dunaliella salina]|eukprot:KAF5836766.1 hypothetical protein DUNSADRAFT_5456 [Dunaliella salina]
MPARQDPTSSFLVEALAIRAGAAGTAQGDHHSLFWLCLQVEALAGRVHATDIALGDHHSLFLDSTGTVWTNGDNKAGQCGLGTPLPVVAQQHRAALIHSLLQGSHAAKAQQQALHPPASHQQHRSSSSSGRRSVASLDSSSSSSSTSSSAGNSGSGATNSEVGTSASSSSSSSNKSNSSRSGGSGISSSLHDRGGLREGGQGYGGGIGGQDLRPGSSYWGMAHKGRGSNGYSQGRAGPERDHWVARASSRIHQQLQQRFQELQGQHAQQEKRMRTRALPVLPQQRQMRQESQEVASLAEQEPISWQHHSGPAHITGSSADWSPATASPLSVLGSGSGLDLVGHCRVAGLLAGQQCTPARLGRDQHALANAVHHALTSDLLGVQISPVQSSAGIPEVVVSIAASSKFSVAVTEEGNVWTWGLSYDGALGFSSAWSTSPQKIGGVLASVISDNGGAQSAVAGATFCLVLTKNGKSIVWGRVPGGRASTPSSSLSGTASAPQLPHSLHSSLHSLVLDSSGQSLTGRVECGEVPGMPPMRLVAAGAEHVLMSDGRREVFDAGAVGIRRLSAGLYSSALVTGAGDLYLWGRLLDKPTSDLLIQREAALKRVLSASSAPASAVTAAAPSPPHLPQLSRASDITSPQQPTGLYSSPSEALAGPIINWQAWPGAQAASPGPSGANSPGLLQERDQEVASTVQHREPAEPVWEWAGFGAAWPTLIEGGLEGRVKDVALGGWHCLALVD